MFVEWADTLGLHLDLMTVKKYGSKDFNWNYFLTNTLHDSFKNGKEYSYPVQNKTVSTWSSAVPSVRRKEFGPVHALIPAT